VRTDFDKCQSVKTKRQVDFKDFKRSRSCVNWALYGTRGPLKLSFDSRFKLAHGCHKKPNLHTNSLNKLRMLQKF
jgi:hypothetical protein